MRKGNTVGDEVLIATYNSKNLTVTDGHLTEIFLAVGQRYGYEDVKAEFAPLKDFKVRWQRSYKWAIFTVSDYLDRAPDAVLEDRVVDVPLEHVEVLVGLHHVLGQFLGRGDHPVVYAADI
ncbi:MAG: hypothetical protein IKP18_04675 [Candidatus Methanomethylophilaceae archaeon]|nr:hypothetical protein [Candidatus Methanomethylophilaceae archaeon]